MIKLIPSLCICSIDGVTFRLPVHLKDAFESYLNDRKDPGPFLKAVIANDLMGAVEHADFRTIGNLPYFADFLKDFAPPECFGSYEKVKAWLEGGK